MLKTCCPLAILVILAGQTFSQCSFKPDTDEPQCERIRSIYCTPDIAGFENTSLPNSFGHTTQEEADVFLTSILYLLGCSGEYLRTFVCSAAFPFCVPNQFAKIGPCQELCVATRESCVQELENINQPWPEQFDCSIFPSHGTTICIWNGGSSSLSCPTPSSSPAVTPSTSTETTTNSTSVPSTDTITESTMSPSNQQSTNCTGHLVVYPNTSRAKFGGIEDCTESCYGVYFDQDEQDFAHIWITTFSLLCLLVSFLTFLTYILQFRELQSPECSIHNISLCYTLVAFTYTISIAMGRETLICNNDFTNDVNESALAIDGIDMPLCGTIFSLLYYFTLCTWMWWAVLTTEWFLCSVKMSSVINPKLKVCFHIVAWSLPLVFLLVALLTKCVSGEPVLRTCWVSKYKELPFLVIPLLVVLVYCSLLIMVTFARIVHIHRHWKHINIERTTTIELSNLIRVGIYCTVYLLPMGLLVCSYWYEYWFREQWEDWYIECVNSNKDCTSNQGPLFPVFIMKYTSTIIMGILTVLWVLRKSSFLAWKKVFCVCTETRFTTSNPGIVFENDHPCRFTYTETTI